MDSQGHYYPASEAARVLDASESATRRYATLYEAIYGPMPRDKQKRRLWTHEAVETLRSAKGLLDTGKAISIQAALEQLRSEAPNPLTVPADPPSHNPQAEALTRLGAALEVVGRLEGEIRLLREKLEEPSKREAELEQMNTYLMRELERYQKQAEAPPADPLNPLKRLYRWFYRRG